MEVGARIAAPCRLGDQRFQNRSADARAAGPPCDGHAPDLRPSAACVEETPGPERLAGRSVRNGVDGGRVATIVVVDFFLRGDALLVYEHGDA